PTIPNFWVLPMSPTSASSSLSPGTANRPPYFASSPCPLGSLRSEAAFRASAALCSPLTPRVNKHSPLQGACAGHRSSALRQPPRPSLGDQYRSGVAAAGALVAKPPDSARSRISDETGWPSGLVAAAGVGVRGVIPRGTLFERFMTCPSEPTRNGSYQFCVVGLDVSTPGQLRYMEVDAREPARRWGRALGASSGLSSGQSDGDWSEDRRAGGMGPHSVFAAEHRRPEGDDQEWDPWSEAAERRPRGYFNWSAPGANEEASSTGTWEHVGSEGGPSSTSWNYGSWGRSQRTLTPWWEWQRGSYAAGDSLVPYHGEDYYAAKWDEGRGGRQWNENWETPSQWQSSRSWHSLTPWEEGKELGPSSPRGRGPDGGLPLGDPKAAGEGGERRGPGKVTSSYPPIFKAQPGESYREWKRQVAFWLGGEAGQLPPQYVGPRVMVQLRERAAQLVRHLNNEDVNGAGGLDLILKTLEMSPLIKQLDRHRVDQHRKKLMSLTRLPNESMESYITRGSIYRTQLQGMDAAMSMGESFYTGHLLDHARLTRRDKAMVKTRAGADTEDAITTALVELAPELEGEAGYPIGMGEPDLSLRQGDECLVQPQRGAWRGPKAALGAEVPSETAGDELPEEIEGLSEQGHSDDAVEVMHAANEAYALHFRAKQKIAEVKKLRQYYGKGDRAEKPSSEERRRAIAEQMKIHPCRICGEHGHWARECPKKGSVNATLVAWAPPSAKCSAPANEADQWSLLASCVQTSDSSQAFQYMKGCASLDVLVSRRGHRRGADVIDVQWCMQELVNKVILDIGCMKSVVGTRWMNSVVRRWREEGRWYKVVRESELFRFGNGTTLRSCYAVAFEATFARKHVILRFSVVAGDCPPLLSKPACSQLGLSIDCGKHCLSSPKLKVKAYGLPHAPNGHYLMNIEEFEGIVRTPIPRDFALPADVEAYVLQTRDPARLLLRGVVMEASRRPSLGGTSSTTPKCRLCGEMGHLAAQCPDLEEPEDPWMEVEDETHLLRRSLRSTTRPKETPTEYYDLTELTPEEKHLLVKRRARAAEARSRKQNNKALTGHLADFPSLSDRWSSDLALNIAGSLRARMITFAWKRFLWLLRVKEAVTRSFPDVVWKRNRRWVANLLMREVGAAWGHLGALKRSLGPWQSDLYNLILEIKGPEEQIDLYHLILVLQVTRPNRGLTQKLKAGVQTILSDMSEVNRVARLNTKSYVLEIVGETVRPSQVFPEGLNWRRAPTFEQIYTPTGAVLLKQWMSIERPDLVIMRPSGELWLPPTLRIRYDPQLQREARSAAMKEWYLVRELWKHQTELKGLMLVDQPFGSEAWELTFLREFPGWHTLVVDKCAFGRRPDEAVLDPPLQGRAHFGVNDASFAVELSKAARCRCPNGHDRTSNLRWEALAGQVWSLGLWNYVLEAAQRVLRQRAPLESWNGLAEPVDEDGWFVAPVANSQLPEEELRRVLGQIGSSGERYDYVTFEGEAAQLPRGVRAAVAHLHSTLGHPGNDRLVRMLVLSGAKDEVLTAARSLRCQVCASVRGPANDPQVSCLKPKMFNAALSGDSFFIFDVEGTKFGVVHYIDGLTDFHVGQCFSQPNSSRAARVLRDSWYGVFGPPDVLRTDGGTEFQGAVTVLNELFGVPHQVIPEGAKYQLGQVERHGGVLKIMLMKMVDALQLKGLEDMRMGVAAGLAAKNRLLTGAGVCPLQAVTGRASPLPLSLMTQLCSGKVKYRLNQSLEDDEEGATVYVYEPPQSRAGQPRRVRDNTSWVGPGTVVCVERDHPTPKRAWVRIKGRVKAVAMERLRLATVDELLGATVVSDFVKELEQELSQGRARVEQPVGDGSAPAEAKPDSSSSSSSSSEAEVGESIVPGMEWDATEERALRRSVATDVPVQLLREREKRATTEREAQMDPHELDFLKKRRLFEKVSDQLEPPTTLEQAAARGQMEDAYQKSQRKVIKALPSKARGTTSASSRGPSIHQVGVAAPGPSPWQELSGEDLDDLFEVYAACEVRAEQPQEIKELFDLSKGAVEEVRSGTAHVMGKDRVELQWRKLDASWRQAFTQPIVEAIQVYIKHEAIEAVPEDRWIPPEKILSSRFVLTNKTKEEPDPFKCKLKGRWIIGGHKDSEAGMHPTASPTASLLGQNLVNFLAVQFGWAVTYEDVTAAFLQGRPLPPEREVYVRLPKEDYPKEIYDLIRLFVGPGARVDMVKMTKGGFGLPESPRLWYQEYKSTLSELGLRELRLLPGVFCQMRDQGHLGAIASIHVDDTRYTGDKEAEATWERLHAKLQFGKRRQACDGWQKFCGRWERQDPTTMEIFYKMDDYVKEIPLLPPRPPGDPMLPLTEYEKKLISSTVGQLMWAGRQARFDLLYGTSHGQQLAGTGDPLALEALNKVVRRAREDVPLVVKRLGVPMDQWCVVTASDAAYGAQPRGASQGGFVIMIGDRRIANGPSNVAILEVQSAKIQRVVRCSMSAELSSGATAFEYGDYVKAVLGEMVLPPFSLKEWKTATMLWRHYLVLDAKTAYDALHSENLPSDRKLLIDIAVLREALTDNHQTFVRWVPGAEMVADALTKWNGNGVLQRVMEQGQWSLADTPELRRLRETAAARKKAILAKAQIQKESGG
ncbi:FV3-083R, partial [Symbiodinium sp. KB8]